MFVTFYLLIKCDLWMIRCVKFMLNVNYKVNIYLIDGLFHTLIKANLYLISLYINK